MTKRERQRLACKKWALAHPEYIREARRAQAWRARGIRLTTPEYNKMWESQGGVCATCRRSEPVATRRLSVDHNHQTEAVRGLLCGPCNRFLGWIGDNPTVLETMIQYLKESNVR